MTCQEAEQRPRRTGMQPLKRMRRTTCVSGSQIESWVHALRKIHRPAFRQCLDDASSEDSSRPDEFPLEWHRQERPEVDRSRELEEQLWGHSDCLSDSRTSHSWQSISLHSGFFTK